MTESTSPVPGGPAIPPSGAVPSTADPFPAPGAAPVPGEVSRPAGPTGGPPSRPRIAPWLLLYTVGRLVIAAALVALLWLVGLGSFPGLLFGLLLSMPASYLLLRPIRDRLTEALAARSVARRAAKEELRARLAGGEPAE